MQFVVKGSKSRQVKWFHCNEDAYDFLDGCEWDDAEVFACYPVKRKPRATVLKKKGNSVAARYLELRGYEILDRDYDTPFGCIDIIAEDEDGTIVFVEVDVSDDMERGFEKSRFSGDRANCEKSATFYGEQSGVGNNFVVRFDVVSLLVCGSFDRAMCRHHINVFGEVC